MTPPRLAIWWLRRCLPTGRVGESIRGDLLEEFRRRRPGSTKPHRCLNVLIVADFPSATKVSYSIKPHSIIGAVRHFYPPVTSIFFRPANSLIVCLILLEMSELEL